MDGFKLGKYLNIVDLAVIGYLLDTLVLSFFIFDVGIRTHVLLFRLLSFITIGFILYHRQRDIGKISAAIHYFYPVVFLSYVYGETASFNQIFFQYSFDSWLVNTEYQLFGFQPAMAFAKNYTGIFLNELMNFSYLSYYLFVFGFPLLAFRMAVDLREKIMFIIINSFIIYYLFFIIFPSYGPQFYFFKGEMPATEGFFHKILRIIQHFGEAPTGAFPSSHVGIMVIFLMLAGRYFKKMLALTLVFTVLILFATVYIKAHYAIDVLAGIISAPIIYWISLKMFSFYKRFLDIEL